MMRDTQHIISFHSNVSPSPSLLSQVLTITLGLHLTCRQTGLPALGPLLQVLTVAAAGRVLVTADGAAVLPQLTVLVAAGVLIFRAHQAGVTLLLALHTQVAAERLLRLRETARRLGLEDQVDGAQGAGRETLKGEGIFGLDGLKKGKS